MKKGHRIFKVLLAAVVLALTVLVVIVGFRLGQRQEHTGEEQTETPTPAESVLPKTDEADGSGEETLPSATPAVTETPAPTATPAVTETPTPVPVVPEVNGYLVCIDPGHQDHGISETEPNGPGSSVMKAKATTGTDGAVSGKHEYEVALEISLRLREELEKRGYTVIMTRESNDTDLSNVDRAVIANDSGVDIFLRLHLNGSDDPSVKGALCYQPSVDNPYLDAGVISESQRLSALLLDNQIRVTGQESMGLLTGDDMTGINWAKMPVSIVEMGFMSNPEEDRFLASEEGQMLVTIGLANGVDAYFGHLNS